MFNVSDLQQEQAATGGLGYPFLESLKPSSSLTLPLTKNPFLSLPKEPIWKLLCLVT